MNRRSARRSARGHDRLGRAITVFPYAASRSGDLLRARTADARAGDGTAAVQDASAVRVGMVGGVSVDLYAAVQEPVSFATVVDAAGATMCELLGLESVPAIGVFAQPLYELGQRVHPGRRMSDRDLAADMIGGRMSAGHFDFRLAGRGDLARFIVVGDEGMTDAVFSPTRTCAGVVLATALSLAAANHGHGQFVDLEIRMTELPEPDPEAFVEHTRLSGQGTNFDLQCERFMRQFTRLNGWPRDVSLAEF